MRLRFTIRDLLWLTAVIAIFAAWWIDHRSQISAHEQYKHNLSHLHLSQVQAALEEDWTNEQVQEAATQTAKELGELYPPRDNNLPESTPPTK